MMFEFHWATLVLMGLVAFVCGAVAASSGSGGGYDA